MLKTIDTFMWKPFRIGDLFELERPVARVVRDYVDGDMPFVASGMNDNGVSCFVRPLHEDDFDMGGCLTVSPLDGSCFWQPSDFLGRGGSGASVCILRNADVDEMRGLFIASVIRTTLRSQANYGNLYTGSKLLDVSILLPATPDGEPDWAYMETYMRQVMGREEIFAEHLASLTAEAVADGHVVDTSAWKAFRVGDLFEIYPTVAHKITNAQLMDDGDNPVVVNSSMNNGIGGFTTQSVTEDGGIITFSDTTDSDSIFYQAEPFVGYPHVQGMHPFDSVKWSDMSLLFFVSTFRAAAAMYGFSYSNKFRRDVATNIYVMLPATPDGAPDCAYMEQYMRDVMAVEALFADELDRLSRE